MLADLMEGFASLVKKFGPYAVFIAFGILCWRWFEFADAQELDLYEPIVNGVIGGFVTSLLILIFSILWKSNITPWIENLLYKDTKIEGVWTGVLVPYIGIDEIDKRRLKIAFGIIERRRKKRAGKRPKKAESSTSKDVAASTSDTDQPEDLEAELILKGDPDKPKSSEDELVDRKFFINISSKKSPPIEVRAEIRRIGHDIKGTFVEIGGMSQIHTYQICGSFKNLILTAEYENEDCSHIDRGSLSLMLRNNGKTLDGFFSSYADEEHRMAPFKCVLKRQHSDKSGNVA